MPNAFSIMFPSQKPLIGMIHLPDLPGGRGYLGVSTLVEKALIDLKNTVYVGDGLNDVESAELISDAGGGVIAVANAISEPKQKATCVSKEAASHGVVEMLELILN